MDQTKLFGLLANDVSTENSEHRIADGANEIRALNDLELMATAGGDGVVCWNSPPTPGSP